VEQAEEFLPRHWNRPQLGYCRRTPRSADVQRRDHVVPLQQPVQEADGERITGACCVYLVGCDSIHVKFAGGAVRIRASRSSCDYHPLESLTRYGAHGFEHPCRGDIVVLRL